MQSNYSCEITVPFQSRINFITTLISGFGFLRTHLDFLLFFYTVHFFNRCALLLPGWSRVFIIRAGFQKSRGQLSWARIIFWCCTGKKCQAFRLSMFCMINRTFGILKCVFDSQGDRHVHRLMTVTFHIASPLLSSSESLSK